MLRKKLTVKRGRVADFVNKANKQEEAVVHSLATKQPSQRIGTNTIDVIAPFGLRHSKCRFLKIASYC